MNKNNNLQMITKLMLKLLPVQILLAAVGSVNGIVSSYFASNYVGIDAMSAVGLYGPANMLLGSIGTMLSGGCAIICGKYLGQNQVDKLKGTFSLDMVISTGVAVIFTVLFVLMGMFNLTGFFTTDPTLRPIFNRYLLGQCIGILPMILGNQLAPFLAMENQSRRTIIASIIYIIVNLMFNFLFVQVFRMEEMGLALASSLGMWVFFAVEAQYFFSKEAQIRFSIRDIAWDECLMVFAIGFPGAATNIYQTVRGLAVNKLLEIHTGSMGLSAFSAANNVLGIFWAIPTGMIAVSRLLISVSIGEEDRQTLGDIMRVMMRRYLPIMGAFIALIILCAQPLTRIFFRDSSVPVYGMMTDALRILPLCMPFSIVCMHLTCYGQASGKQFLVNMISFLDGVVCVTLFSLLLAPSLGVRGVCIANVLNGVACLSCFIGYAWLKQRKFPKTMEELMVIPANFGASEKDRIDLSVQTTEDVVTLSQRIQEFCLSCGIDERRAYYSALAMEEMAGNIVEHGFTKDNKKHSVDVRVVHKYDNVILRIKDDCIPFNPKERQQISENDDITKNIGIRMIYKMIKDIDYQNVLGLNVLTMKV